MELDQKMVFHALFRAHFNASHANLAREGLGDLGSPRLLHTLLDRHRRGETPSQKELADQLHISPATVATSLKSLERNGYVRRQPDPADTRRNLVSITEKAVEAMERSHAVFLSVDRAMFAGFTPAEVERLNEYHRRMLENLYAIGGDRDAPCVPPAPPPLGKEG